MTAINKYRIWCETDDKWEYIWSEQAPTVCPYNNTHSININSIAIIEKTETLQISGRTEVRVLEEYIPTGGHYQARGMVVDAATSGTHYLDISWPHPVSLLSAEWVLDSTHVGDEVWVQVAPNTVIGAVTSGASTSGSNLFAVTQTVIDNTDIGYELHISDGVEYNNLGLVLSIDEENLLISTELSTTSAFNLSGPTYVLQTIHMIRVIYLQAAGPYGVGESKIGGSFLPANTVVRVYYKNNSDVAKRFCPTIEYLY